MGLLSDPLGSLGAGRKVPLVGSGAVSRGAGAGGGGDGRGGLGLGFGGESCGDEEQDPKVTMALEKALVLLEDADMMRRMLEKLLEFDEKKYTAMFQVGGWGG